jgi:hypothetical protein
MKEQRTSDEVLQGLIESAGKISLKLTDDLVDATLAITDNKDRHTAIGCILHLPEICREIERIIEAAIILNKKI